MPPDDKKTKKEESKENGPECYFDDNLFSNRHSLDSTDKTKCGSYHNISEILNKPSLFKRDSDKKVFEINASEKTPEEKFYELIDEIESKLAEEVKILSFLNVSSFNVLAREINTNNEVYCILTSAIITLKTIQKLYLSFKAMLPSHPLFSRERDNNVRYIVLGYRRYVNDFFKYVTPFISQSPRIIYPTEHEFHTINPYNPAISELMKDSTSMIINYIDDVIFVNPIVILLSYFVLFENDKIKDLQTKYCVIETHLSHILLHELTHYYTQGWDVLCDNYDPTSELAFLTEIVTDLHQLSLYYFNENLLKKTNDIIDILEVIFYDEKRSYFSFSWLFRDDILYDVGEMCGTLVLLTLFHDHFDKIPSFTFDDTILPNRTTKQEIDAFIFNFKVKKFQILYDAVKTSYGAYKIKFNDESSINWRNLVSYFDKLYSLLRLNLIDLNVIGQNFSKYSCDFISSKFNLSHYHAKFVKFFLTGLIFFDVTITFFVSESSKDSFYAEFNNNYLVRYKFSNFHLYNILTRLNTNKKIFSINVEDLIKMNDFPNSLEDSNKKAELKKSNKEQPELVKGKFIREIEKRLEHIPDIDLFNFKKEKNKEKKP